MSNDVVINDSVVVAIQGVAVSDETPTDGYVLTYSNSDDGYWGPKPQSGLIKEYFTSNGTWTCPSGVSSILLIGAGAGAGGGGGGRNTHGGGQQPTQGQGGGGGGASIQNSVPVSVSPGLTYDIIIGVGGSGGTGAQNGMSFDNGATGSGGGNTEFKYSSTVLGFFGGAGPGSGGAYVGTGDTRIATPGGANISTPFIYAEDRLNLPVGYGGTCTSTGLSIAGQLNFIGGYTPGSAGTTSGSYAAGAGGAAGPQGNGGNGGNGGATPTNGSSAAANTGAGGGGGGGGGKLSMSVEAGNGGNGGSGYLYIIY